MGLNLKPCQPQCLASSCVVPGIASESAQTVETWEWALCGYSPDKWERIRGARRANKHTGVRLTRSHAAFTDCRLEHRQNKTKKTQDKGWSGKDTSVLLESSSDKQKATRIYFNLLCSHRSQQQSNSKICCLTDSFDLMPLRLNPHHVVMCSERLK